MNCDRNFNAAQLPSFILSLDRARSNKPMMEVVKFEGDIPQGGRNDALYRYGCSLRGNGRTVREVSRELQKLNAEKCNPPLSKVEVQAIIDSVDRFKRGDGAREDFSDSGGSISAADLQAKELPDIRWCVDKLLPQGLAILASAPKFGKSWMALELAIAVAFGDPFLGFKTNPAGTLYLALEDSENRLKSRMNALLRHHGGSAPKNLFLRTDAPTIGNGLLDMLELHLGDHPDCQMIIVDTLQKIRDGASSNKEGAYATDYREVGSLKSFADKHDVCVLMIHHLRKMGDDSDVMARISGTNALTGAADTLMVLSRKRRMDDETTLSLTGRDVEAEEYSLTFDKEAKCWRMRGNLEDVEALKATSRYEQDPLVKTIKALLEESGSWKGTMTELADEVETREGDSYDARALGKRLMALTSELGERDNIFHQPTGKGGRTGRVHHLKKADL